MTLKNVLDFTNKIVWANGTGLIAKDDHFLLIFHWDKNLHVAVMVHVIHRDFPNWATSPIYLKEITHILANFI